MQVTYPAVVQFHTSLHEAARSTQLAEERRAAAQRTRSSTARRFSLGLSLFRAQSAQPERASG